MAYMMPQVPGYPAGYPQQTAPGFGVPQAVDPAQYAQQQMMQQQQAQRVVHRHIHHHVHYHEGNDLDQSGEAQQTGILASPEEQRQIEMQSEARIRQQLEAQDGAGPGMGSSRSAAQLRQLPQVDHGAATPTMHRPASYSQLPPGQFQDDTMRMTRTQEAFRPAGGQGQLPALDAQEMGRKYGVPGFGKSVERAIGSYADSGRPRFGRPSNSGMAPAPF
mmetsp:Transcript_87558/g.157826  ORF Transcript_87558/g.157826 Transcript_87558/m.157826 type:complete len:219 (-) Transcript_87558:56-712(-)